MRRFAVVCLLIPLLLAVPAQARAQVDAAGAAKVRVLFENLIAREKARAGAGASLVFDGPLSVEPAGAYYAVTLPHLRLAYPGGETLEIGMVSVNVAPHEAPGQWKMTFSLPTPITRTDAQNRQLMRLDIGAQKAVGIWDEALQSLAQVEARYGGITASGSRPPMKLDIGELRLRHSLARDARGLWSGPASWGATDFRLEKAGEKLAINKLESAATLDGLDPAALRARPRMAGMEGPLGVFAALSGNLSGLAEGLTSQHTLTGVQWSRAGEAASLAQGRLGLDLQGLRGGKAGLALRLNLADMDLRGARTGFEGIEPESAVLDMAISGLPLESLAEAARGTLEGMAADPKLAQLAGISLLVKIPALLSQAGTMLTVSDIRLAGEDYTAQGSGRAVADIAAANGATAEAKVALQGLEPVIERLKANLAAAPEGRQAQIRNTMGILERLRGAARVETAPEGQKAHVLDFAMNKEGQMLVNGQDAFAVFGGRAKK